MTTNMETVVFDVDDALDRVEGDMELLREILEIYVEETTTSLAILAQAIEEANATAIAEAAHAIKGSSANISAIATREVASVLEWAGRNNDIRSTARLHAELRDQFAQLRTVLGQFSDSIPHPASEIEEVA